MANRTPLRYGSQGSEVAELQRLLNGTGNGYNLAEDGKFGDNTRSAVEDFQKRNGLTVDGIAGDNTFGALSGNTPGNTAPDANANAGVTGNTNQPAFNYGDYKPSSVVQQAEALLQQHMAGKPGEYQSQYGGQIADLVDRILGREQFSFDVNGDALYQQLVNQYTQQGKMAMMDTMGQAAAMTGGYGNSYAQSVGQQAYQQHLQGLNEMVPDLYQTALNQYLQEGQNLYDQVSLLVAQDEQAYGRHRDEVEDFYAQMAQLYNQFDNERNYDYSIWADGRDFEYNQERDKIADSQWQTELDEAKRQHDQSASAGRGSGGGSGNSGGNGGSNNMTAYQKTEEMLIYGGYNSAQMLQVIRSSPLSKEEQDALIEQYQKPLQRKEVEEAGNGRNDTSAHWSR